MLPPVTVNAPIRKSMKRREVEQGIRFLTFSCHRRLPLLRNPAIARLLVDSLSRVREKSGLELFAWVIMPEHVHLLVRPPTDETGEQIDLAPLVKGIKMAVSRRALKRWAELDAPILERVRDSSGNPRFWQKGGGFDRNIRSQSEFCKTVNYIHKNPVERGIVERAEDWRWSSVHWWMGSPDGQAQCDPPPGDPEVWRAWKGFK